MFASHVQRPNGTQGRLIPRRLDACPRLPFADPEPECPAQRSLRECRFAICVKQDERCLAQRCFTGVTNLAGLSPLFLFDARGHLPQTLTHQHFARMSGYIDYSDCMNGTGYAFCIDCSALTSYDGLTAVWNIRLTASQWQPGIQSAGLDNQLMTSACGSALRQSGETYSECGEGERDHAVFSERPERPLGLATFQREAADCLAVLRQQNRLDPAV